MKKLTRQLRSLRSLADGSSSTLCMSFTRQNGIPSITKDFFGFSHLTAFANISLVIYGTAKVIGMSSSSFSGTVQLDTVFALSRKNFPKCKTRFSELLMVSLLTIILRSSSSSCLPESSEIARQNFFT